jgi:uncharacterized protein YdgA (DUF945 family)
MILNNYTLLSNGSATGDAVQILRGKYQFHVSGTFSGATVTLQWRRDSDRDWTAVSAAATLTAVGNPRVDLGDGQVRVLIASGSPSGLYVYLMGLE